MYKGRANGGCDVAGPPELAAMEDFDLRGAAEGHSDGEVERVLRPSGFDEFAGQREALDNPEIFVKAASRRGESMDHVLFHGPPGLSSTGPLVVLIETPSSAATMLANVVLPNPGGP